MAGFIATTIVGAFAIGAFALDNSERKAKRTWRNRHNQHDRHKEQTK